MTLCETEKTLKICFDQTEVLLLENCGLTELLNKKEILLKDIIVPLQLSLPKIESRPFYYKRFSTTVDQFVEKLKKLLFYAQINKTETIKIQYS